jgi:hypothetical protein
VKCDKAQLTSKSSRVESLLGAVQPPLTAACPASDVQAAAAYSVAAVLQSEPLVTIPASRQVSSNGHYDNRSSSASSHIMSHNDNRSSSASSHIMSHQETVPDVPDELPGVPHGVSMDHGVRSTAWQMSGSHGTGLKLREILHSGQESGQHHRHHLQYADRDLVSKLENMLGSRGEGIKQGSSHIMPHPPYETFPQQVQQLASSSFSSCPQLHLNLAKVSSSPLLLCNDFITEQSTSLLSSCGRSSVPLQHTSTCLKYGYDVSTVAAASSSSCDEARWAVGATGRRTRSSTDPGC